MADIIQIDENTWRFEDGFVRFFLLAGEEKAVMIDLFGNAVKSYTTDSCGFYLQ